MPAEADAALGAVVLDVEAGGAAEGAEGAEPGEAAEEPAQREQHPEHPPRVDPSIRLPPLLSLLRFKKPGTLITS